MLYTGRDQTPRMGEPQRTGERRAFTRRIDCEDTPRTRQPDVHAEPAPRDRRATPAGRRAYDID